MIPVNITINVEQTENRRTMHGALVFASDCDIPKATRILASYLFDYEIPSGFLRSVLRITEHIGGKHFIFFITDEKPAEVSP